MSVSGSDRRYWDDDTKKPLGIGGFPPELTLSLRPGPEGANRIGTEVPAVPFKENAVSCFHEEIKIFVTPYQYFNAKFRAIFTRTKVQRSSGAESERFNSSTSQYGAQRQDVVDLVKFSIRFQNRSSRF